MKKLYFPLTNLMLTSNLEAVLLVFAITIPMWLIGRDILGEAVIALLYLLPITWSAFRFGQLPGISAALAASLTFDFLFIPPFYTFAIARLEGWLVLIIFLGIAVVVIGRIQTSISKARAATFMYEICTVLSKARTQDATARILARHIQQFLQASLVRVVYRLKDSTTSIIFSQPENLPKDGRPDRVLPILNAWGLIGEIQIWEGHYGALPPEDSPLLQNFALQAAQTFERTQSMEAEKIAMSVK